MVTDAIRGCACAWKHGLAAVSKSSPFPYTRRPTVSLSSIDPKREYLQQNLISTNLFITVLWAKFQRFFFPFKDTNQKMCKRVGSTSPHTLHSESQGKCSLFAFCTQEGVETCNDFHCLKPFPHIFPTARRYSTEFSDNMKLSKQVKLSSMARISLPRLWHYNKAVSKISHPATLLSAQQLHRKTGCSQVQQVHLYLQILEKSHPGISAQCHGTELGPLSTVFTVLLSFYACSLEKNSSRGICNCANKPKCVLSH